MRIKSIAILLIAFLNIEAYPQTFSHISKLVSDHEFKTGIRKYYKDIYFEVRKKLDAMGKLSFLNNSDSIYMLESSSIESGAIYGKIWSSNGVLDFYYSDRKFNFEKSDRYTKYCCNLIQKWDTISIRNEEKNHPSGFSPEYLYGTRIIRKNDKIEISCIFFKDFPLLDRDRNN